MNTHRTDVDSVENQLSLKKKRTSFFFLFYEIHFWFLFTRIELSDSLVYKRELFSKQVSFVDEQDESVNEGELTIDSGRSRVTVPVCLCQ